MSDLEIEELLCPYCEKHQDDCLCCDSSTCPVCKGDMDPLDASLCAGCQGYYPECTCKMTLQTIGSGDTSND